MECRSSTRTLEVNADAVAMVSPTHTHALEKGDALDTDSQLPSPGTGTSSRRQSTFEVPKKEVLGARASGGTNKRGLRPSPAPVRHMDARDSWEPHYGENGWAKRQKKGEVETAEKVMARAGCGTKKKKVRRTKQRCAPRPTEEHGNKPEGALSPLTVIDGLGEEAVEVRVEEVEKVVGHGSAKALPCPVATPLKPLELPESSSELDALEQLIQPSSEQEEVVEEEEVGEAAGAAAGAAGGESADDEAWAEALGHSNPNPNLSEP